MKQSTSTLGKGGRILPLITLVTLALTGISHAGHGAIEVAKSHVSSNLTSDHKKLAETYAPNVVLMPGHEYLKEKYGLAKAGARGKGAEVKRGKLIATLTRASAGLPAFPVEHAERVLDKLKYQSVKVHEGDFATDPSDPVETQDGKLHFMIKKGDLLIKVAPAKGDFVLLQLREEDDSWRVVAEYL